MAEMRGRLSFPAAHQNLVTYDSFLAAVKSHVDAKFAMSRDVSPESQVHTLASCRIEPLALPKCAAESRASMLTLVQIGNILRAPPRTLPRTRRESGDAAFLRAFLLDCPRPTALAYVFASGIGGEALDPEVFPWKYRLHLCRRR